MAVDLVPDFGSGFAEELAAGISPKQPDLGHFGFEDLREDSAKFGSEVVDSVQAVVVAIAVAAVAVAAVEAAVAVAAVEAAVVQFPVPSVNHQAVVNHLAVVEAVAAAVAGHQTVETPTQAAAAAASVVAAAVAAASFVVVAAAANLDPEGLGAGDFGCHELLAQLMLWPGG
mmetsp:Transcript_13345/g.17603  ORF Transcript_13345/g.17603 Transcript_13345/m.17603 type:complete len:172 (-) Transcript_13345:1657-2172(-)